MLKHQSVKKMMGDMKCGLVFGCLVNRYFLIDRKP